MYGLHSLGSVGTVWVSQWECSKSTRYSGYSLDTIEGVQGHSVGVGGGGGAAEGAGVTQQITLEESGINPVGDSGGMQGSLGGRQQMCWIHPVGDKR